MINALKIMGVLRESGLDDKTARAIAETQKISVEESGLAAKEDIKALEFHMGLLGEKLTGLETLVKIMFGALMALVIPIFLKTFF